jgi:hypothetical protein
MDHSVLHNLQDHLGTRTHDLDHLIICLYRKHWWLVHQEGGFEVCFSYRRSDGSHIRAHLLNRRWAFDVRWLLPWWNRLPWELWVHRWLLCQIEPLSKDERLRHRLHSINPQWATVPVADTDRGLHRGVPHTFKWRKGLWPPLSLEARSGGSACSRHNPTVAGGHSGHPVYDNGSITGAGTVTAHRPLLQLTTHSTGGAMSTCPCLATQRWAVDIAVMKQARQQASDGYGPATRATVVWSRTRVGEDPKGGLCHHPSSGQGGGSLFQLWGGPDGGHCDQDSEHLTFTHHR